MYKACLRRLEEERDKKMDIQHLELMKQELNREMKNQYIELMKRNREIVH